MLSEWKNRRLEWVAVWLLLWIAVALIVYLASGMHPNGAVIVFGILFYYADIYLIDGWLIWKIAGVFGSKTTYREHTAVIGTWKPVVLTIQIVAVLLAMKGLAPPVVYYTTLAAELYLFYITFIDVHHLPRKRATIISVIILMGMVLSFRYSQMASLIAELAGQQI